MIYGHCIQHLLSGDVTNNYAYLFIYSFHMPLFMIMSGYFSHTAMKLPFFLFIIKKAKQLLLPCISWGAIICSIRFLIGDYQSLSSIIRNDLWFLKSLFICMCLTYVVLRVHKLYQPFFFIALIMLMQVSIFRLKDMYISFLFGFYLKEYWDSIVKYSEKLLFLFTVVYVVLGIHFINPSFFDVYKSDVLGYIIKQFAIIFIGISGSMILILLMNKLCNTFSFNFLKLGKYTLGIYLIQSVLLEVILSHYFLLDNLKDSYLCIILFPIIGIAIIAISVYVIRFIETKRIMSLILLGKE